MLMKPEVSIVIVCMNNMQNLRPCLDSIMAHTTVSYETLVVAYLFSHENLKQVRAEYPWVKIIESHDIRGFSENNNLALRKARGEFCFVLNDDTEMNEPVVDRLVETIRTLPDDVAIVSPKVVYPNGEVQCCGRPPKSWRTFLLGQLRVWSEKDGEYVNGSGIFQSYNILGAAFLIKTEIFEREGWFDEFYFFCPEDIALSTRLNEKGYRCFVNADVQIIHKEGMSARSSSMIQTATKPAAIVGSLHFYSGGSRFRFFFLASVVFCSTFVSFLFHRTVSLIKRDAGLNYVLSVGAWNMLCSIFSQSTPKDVFVRYYRQLKA